MLGHLRTPRSLVTVMLLMVLCIVSVASQTSECYAVGLLSCVGATAWFTHRLQSGCIRAEQPIVHPFIMLPTIQACAEPLQRHCRVF
jgi:hypothetical protein